MTYGKITNSTQIVAIGYHVPRAARNIPVFISSWLVVSTPLKNSQLGWLFPIYGKNVPHHQAARFKSVTWPCGLWFLKLAITYPDYICGSISMANRNKKETQSRKHSFQPSHVYIHSSAYPLVNKHSSHGKSWQVAVSFGTEIGKSSQIIYSNSKLVIPHRSNSRAVRLKTITTQVSPPKRHRIEVRATSWRSRSLCTLRKACTAITWIPQWLSPRRTSTWSTIRYNKGFMQI